VEIRTIDLKLMGAGQVIGAFVVPSGDGGCLLIETGPASCLEALIGGMAEAGFAPEDLRAIMLTHIHLDHGGAAGTLARRTGCEVWVHPEGATHLIDPSKLLASAERLYGDKMIPLWGRTESVPAGQVRLVADGERMRIGSTEVIGWFTPGHAVHHVAWQVGGAVATGDVAGVRFPGATHVLPPTPPPDIDVAAWQASLARLRELAPERLLLTHFGAFDDPTRHIDELEDRLLRWVEVARQATARGSSVSELAEELTRLDEIEMRASGVGPEAKARYDRLCPMDGNAPGLARYWLKLRESGLEAATEPATQAGI